MIAGCHEPALASQLTGSVCCSPSVNVLQMQSHSQVTVVCFLAFLLLKEQCSWTFLYPTSNPPLFFSVPFGSFYGPFAHTMGVLFLGNTVSLFHLLSIILSVSICLCCINYSTSHPSYANRPLYFHLICCFTFTWVPSAHSFQADVFSHLSFTATPISFSSVFTHPSPVTIIIPLLFLSLSLGTIKVSAVSHRVMESPWHVLWRN